MAKISTDKSDYAPGETATIMLTEFDAGMLFNFYIQEWSTDPGNDGFANTYILTPVTDGGVGDLDGLRNGQIVTSWVVEQSALNATLDLTAVNAGMDGTMGTADDVTATMTFTDSLPINATVDLTVSGNTGVIDGVRFSNVKYSAGTGIIDPFVRVQTNGNEEGYNSSANENKQFDETGNYGSQYNHALALSNIPITYIYNATTQQFDAYRQFLLDINENTGNGQQYLSLDALQIYQSNSSVLYNFTGSPTSTGTFTQGGTSSLRYNLDATGNNWIALDYSLNPGSGYGDVAVYVPDSLFNSDQYVYVYSAFGNEANDPNYQWETSDGFEEWSIGVGAPRSVSTITGSKFFDANSDGIFNTVNGDKAWTPANGFLTPVTIYLDQNQDNTLSWTDSVISNGTWDLGEGERWTTTDSSGNYTFTNLAAGLGTAPTYYVREEVPTGFTQKAPLNGSYPTGVTGENSTVNNFTITVEIKTVMLPTTYPHLATTRPPASPLTKS